MDSFPYDSWEEALADASQSQGYFTFAPTPDGSLISNIIVALAIIISVGFLLYLTANEDRHMTKLAAELAEEWKE